MNTTLANTEFDQRILELIPHRPPMLLIHELVEVASNRASALIRVSEDSPFYSTDLGVPSWIGLEYMGQTAALIGGYQQQITAGEAQVGFLLGTRGFIANTEYFTKGQTLLVTSQEKASVGEGLAQFECDIIETTNDNKILASATLSVFRKPASSLK